MNSIVKVKQGENAGLYKWISSKAIYYANKEGPLWRRGAPGKPEGE